MWSFGNDFTRNVVIFDVDNSSSSHIDNHKNIFLGLGGRPTDDINGSVGTKSFLLIFSTAKTKFCFSLHYSGNNSYFLLTEKK